MMPFINMKNRNIIAFIITSLVLVIVACNKEETLPDNPYDNVDYGDQTSYTDTLDPNSIVAIQRDIFHPRCANPGCHDGTFEPDFRTVQSSYTTMVYHKIIKNNAAEDFTFRVVPFNTAESVLYERITNCCFVNQDDRMPQDNIGQGLDQEDIDRIGAWISEGAKDFTGTVPTYPNTEPSITYFTALDPTYTTDYSQNRVDDVVFNPFLVPYDAEVIVVPLVSDDSTSIPNLINPTLKFSLTMDGFDVPALEIAGNALSVPGQGDFMLCQFNTNQFAQGDTVYMRFSCNDGDHLEDTQFPTDQSIDLYKTYWSFIVE